MERRRRARRAGALLVVVGITGALAGGPAVADDGTGALVANKLAVDQPAAQVEWGACPEDVAAEAQPHVLTCATVPVPLDYSDPEGAEIDIMISRLASEDPVKRRGVLMLNPGGPGSPGLTLSAVLASRGIPQSVLDTYDLIGMDTRGVGHSAPVSCEFTTDGEYASNVPPYAVDEAAVTEQARIAESVAEQCAKNDRDGRMRHVSTANMARDLDRIRAALGEDKASYLGYSYGTALGAAYASMFPERADRIVLDSNVGDTHLDRDGLRRFALGVEQTFPDFARWAAKRDAAFGLGRTPAQVRATYFQLAERLDKEPVQGIDGGVFRFLTFVGLYSATTYGPTAQTWQSLLDSDGSAARRLLDSNLFDGGGLTPASAPASASASASASAPTPTPTASGEVSPYSNNWSVFLAVTCNDVDWAEDVQAYQRAVAEDRAKFPLYGAATANIIPCAYWQYEPAEPPVEITDEGPRNVLILQNLRDPATPHRGGELLREKFGDRSRLVSVDDSGHGVFGLGDNACAWNVTTSYLVDGTMPTRDTFCPAS